MPTYTLTDDPLFNLLFGSATTQSMQPLAVFSAFGQELARYRVDGGRIRFPLVEAVPTDLIERTAKFRAQE